MIDLATGAMDCQEGMIEIVQDDSGHNAAIGQTTDSGRNTEPVPTIWQPLSESQPGRVGWVAENGGLISNLKIWENVTLPLWYHSRHEVTETEQRVMHWLGVLEFEPDACAEFMAALPYSIEPWQRKLAGLLRAFVQMPQVLVVDADLFDDVKARLQLSWITALEAYAAQGNSVLVMADKATTLPWTMIE